MKKKVFNAAQLDVVRRKINNALTDEGKELGGALKALIDELEAAEEEIDLDTLKEEILAIVNKNAEVPEAVAEQIANAVKGVYEKINNSVNSGKKSDTLPVKVKNEICGAILKAHGKEEVKNAVENVLVKNAITGLTFGDVVDYTIVENWGNFNPLFSQLHKTMYTKFFYNDDDLNTAGILAKQWDKSGNIEKVIQTLAVEGRTIATKYIYKRQQIAQEDIDEIVKAGEESNFLAFLNEELDRQIVNTIVLAILMGDTINAAGQRVTSFETIGNKSVSDAFTAVLNPAGASVVLSDLRRLADSVSNPYGKKKVMVMSTTTLSNVSRFIYASGGSETYQTKETLAGMLGVDEIITIDIVTGGVHAICLLPDGYWYNEKNTIDVTYPTWEKNVLNYQKERNIGGKIHDLLSTAVLKDA